MASHTQRDEFGEKCEERGFDLVTVETKREHEIAEQLARAAAAADVKDENVAIFAPSEENLVTWKNLGGNSWKEPPGRKKRAVVLGGAGTSPPLVISGPGLVGTTLQPDTTPCVGWTETKEWHERDCASSIIICQAKHVQVTNRQP